VSGAFNSAHPSKFACLRFTCSIRWEKDHSSPQMISNLQARKNGHRCACSNRQNVSAHHHNCSSPQLLPMGTVQPTKPNPLTLTALTHPTKTHFRPTRFLAI
jgi:hypothetical protein